MRLSAIIPQKSSICDWNDAGRTVFYGHGLRTESSPVAVIVGKPDFGAAVPVRLHSACLTGDVFGSRRCDCGDQLRLALARLEELGGGVQATRGFSVES